MNCSLLLVVLAVVGIVKSHRVDFLFDFFSLLMGVYACDCDS